MPTLDQEYEILTGGIKYPRWKTPKQQNENIIDELLSKRPEVAKYLHPKYSDLYDPFLMHHMTEVCDRMIVAVQEQKSILIYGDYDVDGMTSTALLYEGLKKIGAKVDYFLPHRVQDGYGLNIKNIQTIADQGVDMLITVDNGITAVAEVELAQSLGIEVIITDHHHAPDILPDCLILNPHKPDCTYPCSYLVGVGVVYKLLQALSQTFPQLDEHFLKWNLDIVALGTVVDCAPLKDENRLLVALGLIAIQKTKRPAINEFCKYIEKPQTEISVGTLGFQLGPRLNAAGRLDHPDLGIKFLLGDTATSREGISRLDTINRDRQQQVATALASAELQVSDDSPLIVVSDPHWAEGIVGLIAGKLAEAHFRPVIAMTKSGDHYVGSARCPLSKTNITEIIGTAKEVLLKFGGHRQAAGFSCLPEHLEQFTNIIKKTAKNTISAAELQPSLKIHTMLHDADWSFKIHDALEQLTPFGMGNSRPVLCLQSATIQRIFPLGKSGDHVKIIANHHNQKIECVGFGWGNILNSTENTLKTGDTIDIAGTMKINEWKGNKTLQFFIEDIRKVT